MSKMYSEEDLKKKLNIKDIKDLKDPENQKKYIKKIKASRISSDLLKNILTTVPDLTKAFTEVIKAMRDIGTSLEETKRMHWQFLQQIASSGNLSGDEILDAMRIIQKIEKSEAIDWETIYKSTLVFLGVIATVAVFILSKGKVKLKA